MPRFDQVVLEYKDLYNSLSVGSAHEGVVASMAKDIVAGRSRYEVVSDATGVPWYVVGVIHAMECSKFPQFTQHLHNGDSLKARTVQKPRGRPMEGNPPFTFEESAIDALEYDNLASNHDWCVERIAYLLEGYNGWGTRARGIHTPYLWSFSQHYSHGKYVHDGQWSSTAVSDQPGAMVLLKRVAEIAKIDIPRYGAMPSPYPREAAPPLHHSGTLSGIVQAAAGVMLLFFKSIGVFAQEVIVDVQSVKDMATTLLTLADKEVANVGMACIVVGLAVAATRRISAYVEGRIG